MYPDCIKYVYMYALNATDIYMYVSVIQIPSVELRLLAC